MCLIRRLKSCLNLIRRASGTMAIYFLVCGTAISAESESAEGDGVKERILETEIVRAVVYGGDARITRRGGVNLEAGEFRLVCRDLPPDFDQSSLHVEGRGTGKTRITGIDLKRITRREFNSEKYDRLVAELEEFRESLRKTRIERRVVSQRKRFVSSFSDLSLNKATEQLEGGGFSTGEWDGIIQFFEDENMETETRLSDLGRKADQLNEKINTISATIRRMNMDAEEGRAVVINCLVDQADKLSLDVVYNVSGASWSPEYRCTYRAKQGIMELGYYAGIWQGTGEDWKQVPVILSTARPEKGAAPPGKISPLVLKGDKGAISGTVRESGNGEPVEYANVIVWDAIGGMTDEEGSFRITGIPRGEYTVRVICMGYRDKRKRVAIRPGETTVVNFTLEETIVAHTETIDVAAERKMMDLDGAGEGRKSTGNKPGVEIPQMEAGIMGSEFSASLEIQRPVTLESGSDPKRVLIAKRELEGKFFLNSIPRVSEKVYLRGDFSNSMQLAIMPGEAQIYVETGKNDGSGVVTTFVGSEKLEPAVSGEDFSLHFGIDQDIKVEHRLVRKEDLSREGAEKTRIRYLYTIELESFKSDSATVHLADRIPVSAMERIDVDDIDIEPEPDSRGENGILNWDILLQPGGRKKINFSYEVEFPSVWTAEDLELD